MALLRVLLEEYCSQETAGIGKMTLDGSMNDIICCFCVLGGYCLISTDPFMFIKSLCIS